MVVTVVMKRIFLASVEHLDEVAVEQRLAARDVEDEDAEALQVPQVGPHLLHRRLARGRAVVRVRDVAERAPLVAAKGHVVVAGRGHGRVRRWQELCAAESARTVPANRRKPSCLVVGGGDRFGPTCNAKRRALRSRDERSLAARAPRHDRVLLGAVARDGLAEGRRELPVGARRGRSCSSGWSWAGALLVLGLAGLPRGPAPAGNPAAARVRRAAGGGAHAADAEQRRLQPVRLRLARGAGAGRLHDGRAGCPTASGTPGSAQHWNEKVCVYGPTTLVASPAGGARRRAARGWRSSSSASSWLAPARARHGAVVPAPARTGRFFHAMVWLNPLWLLEGPGQLHADLLGRRRRSSRASSCRRGGRERRGLGRLRARGRSASTASPSRALVLALRGADGAAAPRCGSRPWPPCSSRSASSSSRRSGGDRRRSPSRCARSPA